MSKIAIGTAKGKPIAFNTDLLLATRLLITADSGGGKSWLARVLFEQAFGKLQIIIIDPEGEFATLREKFPFVLAGKGGDTPVDLRSAGMLAHRLLKLRASAVCDLYEMKAHERHLWVRDFFNALIEAPKELRVPLLLGVDEFHVFAPEKGQGESEAKQASIDIATRGRKRGICLVGITQRLAMLDKNVTSQLQNRLIGPTFEEVNIATAIKLLGIAEAKEKAAFHREIQLLEPGNFFALGRAISKERILIQVRSVETSHPKAFEKHTAAPPPMPDEIKALLPQLADLPAEAEKKARTVAELEKTVRELRQELKKRPTETKTATVTVADPRAIERAVKTATAPLLRQIEQIRRQVKQTIENFSKAAAPLNAIANLPEQEISRAVPPMPTSAPVRIQAPTVRAVPAPTNGDAPLSNSQRKVLSRLVELLECTNQPSVKKEQLAAWSEYSPTSGGYNNLLGSLRSAGLIEYPQPGMVTITAGGWARASTSLQHISVSSDEMLDRAKRVLGGSEAKLIEILHRSRETWTKEQLGHESGFSHTSGGFNNYLGHMRTLGFVEYPAPGQVKAADWLYL